MRCLLAYAASIALSIALHLCLQSQLHASIDSSYAFEQVTTLYGAEITDVLQLDGALYAVTERAGVFQSLDSGRHWTFLIYARKGDFGFSSGQLFAVQRNNVTLDVDYAWLVRSSDRGLTWQTLKQYASIGGGGFSALYISFVFADSSIVAYEHVPSVGLANNFKKSTDLGETWTALDSVGIYEHPALSLFVFNGRNYCVVNKDSVVQAFISFNSGLQWLKISDTLFRHTRILTADFHNGVLLIGTDSAGVFRSLDSGRTWISSNSGLGQNTISRILECGAFFQDSAHNRFLVQRTIDRSSMSTDSIPTQLWISRDDGQSWSPVVEAPIPGNATFVISSQTIYVGTEAGMYRRSTLPTTWIECDSGICVPSINGMLSSGTWLYVWTTGGRLWKSNDDARTWKRVVSPLQNGMVLYDVTRVWSASSSDICVRKSKIEWYRSTNNGDTWSAVHYAGADDSANRVQILQSESYLNLLSSSRLYEWDSNQQRWKVLHEFDTTIHPCWALFRRNSTIIVSGPSASGSMLSRDNGQTWTSSDGTFNKLCFITDSDFVDVVQPFFLNSIRYSHDAGLTWQTATIDDRTYYITTPYSCSIDNKFLIGTDRGLSQSTDVGQSFTFIPFSQVFSRDSMRTQGARTYSRLWYSVLNNTLYMNWYQHGLYRSELLATVDVADNSSVQPLRVWPQPVQSRAELQLTDAANDATSIRIYDLMGNDRTLDVPVSINMNTSRVTLSTDALSSGVYLIRVGESRFSHSQLLVVSH